MASPTFPGDLARHGWSDRVAGAGRGGRPTRPPPRPGRPGGSRPLPGRHRLGGDDRHRRPAAHRRRLGAARRRSVRRRGGSPRCSRGGRSSTATVPGRPPRRRRWRPMSTSSSSPPASTGRCGRARVERELVVAWDSGARPVVVLTKSDTHPDPDAAAAELATRVVGAEVVVTSATRRPRDGRGAGPHRPERHRGAPRRVRCRQVDARQPPARRGALRGRGGARARTTRAGTPRSPATSCPCPDGGVLIDTPGLRGIGMWEAEEGLSLAFADIEELAEGCRFSDCDHDTEPGCAVTEAIAAGVLSADRLDELAEAAPRGRAGSSAGGTAGRRPSSARDQGAAPRRCGPTRRKKR